MRFRARVWSFLLRVSESLLCFTPAEKLTEAAAKEKYQRLKIPTVLSGITSPYFVFFYLTFIKIVYFYNSRLHFNAG